jgi:hypothetical protein
MALLDRQKAGRSELGTTKMVLTELLHMTLNLTLVAPWGIWQCSDHRLLDPSSGRILDSSATKHVWFECGDGRALLTYAGVGKVNDVEISEWVRGVLRGDNRSVAAAIEHLRDRATAEMSPLIGTRFEHSFTVGAHIGKRAWLFRVTNEIHGRLQRQFTAQEHRFGLGTKGDAERPKIGLFIDGVRSAVVRQDAELLGRVLKRQPRDKRDLDRRHAALAAINRRASARYPTLISPTCTTAWLPVDGPSLDVRSHWSGTAPPVSNLYSRFGVWRGIDLQEITKAHHKASLPFFEGRADATSTDEAQRLTEEAARRSVQPRTDAFRRKKP